jgi:hypothetical protein
VIWEKGYSYFFKIGRGELKKEEKVKILGENFIKTALSSFPQYGIQFITDDSYYYYEPAVKKLDLEDIILHTLLIEESISTNRKLACLLSLISLDVDIGSCGRSLGFSGQTRGPHFLRNDDLNQK